VFISYSSEIANRQATAIAPGDEVGVAAGAATLEELGEMAAPNRKNQH
jgi:hypothetical protein